MAKLSLFWLACPDHLTGKCDTCALWGRMRLALESPVWPKRSREIKEDRKSRQKIFPDKYSAWPDTYYWVLKLTRTQPNNHEHKQKDKILS